MGCKPTLTDWMEAHRALLEEETRLMSVAAQLAARRSDLKALREQQARLLVFRERADAVYAEVMDELRRPE